MPPSQTEPEQTEPMIAHDDSWIYYNISPDFGATNLTPKQALDLCRAYHVEMMRRVTTAQDMLEEFAALAREHDTLVSIVTDYDGDFVVDIGGGRIVDSCNVDMTVETINMCINDRT